MAYCSICESTVSRLEGLILLNAPIVRALSRIWRVCFGLLLHLREHCLAFGGFDSTECSNRESLVSRLEVLFWIIAPFARTISRIWRVCCCVVLHLREHSLIFGACRRARASHAFPIASSADRANMIPALPCGYALASRA